MRLLILAAGLALMACEGHAPDTREERGWCVDTVSGPACEWRVWSGGDVTRCTPAMVQAWPGLDCRICMASLTHGCGVTISEAARDACHRERRDCRRALAAADGREAP